MPAAGTRVPIRTRLENKRLIDHQGCWIWQGAKDRYGYGVIRITEGIGHANRRVLDRFVHRVAYEEYVGPIPEGLAIDHLCRVKVCFNPTHIEPVTIAENNRRREYSHTYATHCKRGHEFDEANTYRSGGRRSCRACNRDSAARRKARMKGLS